MNINEPNKIIVCQKCVDRLKNGPGNRTLDNMIEVGKPIIHEQSNQRTEYQHYKCQICGKLWCKVIDSGFGGYDSYIHPENESNTS
jgi:predicted molibdopterin-dependent oxidoreductase YjgC